MKQYILLLILLVGCTCPECPKQVELKCPKCTTTEVQENDVYAYFINVGQGDAILVKSGDTEMLIDCGKNSMGETVVDYLKTKGVTELEYLLITHPDSDHLGGCDDVLKRFKTNIVITNGESKDTKSYNEVMNEIDTEQLITANEGNEWKIGGSTMKVLQANNILSNSNQNSIVTKLEFGPAKLLLTGDCDRECERLLLNKDIDVDVLKVAHHGSKFGTGIDLLEKTTPAVAIISVGENSYGHPSPQTLDILGQEGVIIYRTDINGHITLKMHSRGYEVIK